MKTNILPFSTLALSPTPADFRKKPLTNVNGGGVGPLWLNSDVLILSYWQPANRWHGPFLRMTRVDSLHANERFYWKFNKRLTWKRKPGPRDTGNCFMFLRTVLWFVEIPENEFIQVACSFVFSLWGKGQRFGCWKLSYCFKSKGIVFCFDLYDWGIIHVKIFGEENPLFYSCWFTH